MVDKLQSFNVLSYFFLYDMWLFCEGGIIVVELLLLVSGVVQIFYGDELLCLFGFIGLDLLQGICLEMNWQDVNGKVVCSVIYWQKIGQFCVCYLVIGMGKQIMLLMLCGYGFVCESGEDKVMVIWVGQQQ